MAVRRRLLIRPGAIGDVIVSLPALEALRAAETELWVPAALVPLVSHAADRVRAISSTGIDLLELGRAPATLIQTLTSFDDIVSWYGSNREEFRSSARAWPFRFFPALPPGVPQHTPSPIHAVDFYLAQTGLPTGATPRIPIRSARHSQGGQLALHPFSGSASKNWPLDRFRELATRIPFEFCHDLFADLGDLAAWLSGARLFVGNDSGITHLAAALGVPTLALFGPTDPRVWAPRGACVIRAEPIESLTVDRVHQAVIDLLR